MNPSLSEDIKGILDLVPADDFFRPLLLEMLPIVRDLEEGYETGCLSYSEFATNRKFFVSELISMGVRYERIGVWSIS